MTCSDPSVPTAARCCLEAAPAKWKPSLSPRAFLTSCISAFFHPMNVVQTNVISHPWLGMVYTIPPICLHFWWYMVIWGMVDLALFEPQAATPRASLAGRSPARSTARWRIGVIGQTLEALILEALTDIFPRYFRSHSETWQLKIWTLEFVQVLALDVTWQVSCATAVSCNPLRQFSCAKNICQKRCHQSTIALGCWRSYQETPANTKECTPYCSGTQMRSRGS